LKKAGKIELSVLVEMEIADLEEYGITETEDLGKWNEFQDL